MLNSLTAKYFEFEKKTPASLPYLSLLLGDEEQVAFHQPHRIGFGVGSKVLRSSSARLMMCAQIWPDVKALSRATTFAVLTSQLAVIKLKMATANDMREMRRVELLNR